ncbi:hypothetical protein PR003_g32191 [Phytophthora rubi]|uniref:Amino acid transporter transmembrane domain-containing protein n=1 Tax=Phytophthora rubi TaxID=129364 RepID=A0A6A4B181_9STRA|nr:hypothetical protein PR003_g32191 [Phytophthora rubi]
MALVVLPRPVCLVPTRHPSVQFPELKFSQVTGVFGNLLLADGAGIVIPDLQCQHSDLSRMPRVVGVSVGLIARIFLMLTTSTAGVVYLFVQLNITVAFAVIVNPAFYIAKRHAQEKTARPRELRELRVDCHAKRDRRRAAPQLQDVGGRRRERAQGRRLGDDRVTRGLLNTVKYVVLRVAIVVVLVVLVIVFKDHFSDFADFVGASDASTKSWASVISVLMAFTTKPVEPMGTRPSMHC